VSRWEISILEISLRILTNELIVGSGYTVEGQKTGEEKHGGLQIEIIPSYKENLRVLLREPREGTEHEIYSTALDWSRRLDELKTSAELSLLPGDKIRSYPANPTGSVPYVMLDLIADSQIEETHVKVCQQFLQLM
jgi:hypothetical protein